MVERDTEKEPALPANLDSSYVSMISDANRILDTLSRAWKYCLTALLTSLSAIGLASLALFLSDTTQEQFLTEGIIFLAIAAWIFSRNILGSRNQCCNEDIPRWKAILSSFLRPDNTFDSQHDGQSALENLMKVILATNDWIKTIKRDVFSVLFWPILAVGIFLLSIYQVNVLELRILEIAFVAYMVILTSAVYYGVNLKFRKWQTKAANFKAFTASALENL